ncbi:hypothetical protein FACS189430_08700 [Bacteroidia bacterium]|nr:hypothetical protein FACS189430_08700 [Bacteroidia bacterium]
MSIKVGCFALVNPFCTLPQQLEQIKKWGFTCADVTDSTDGACLGAEYGFTAVASLDANPFDLKRLFEQYQLTMTSVCAHANLLDPAAPFRYGTSQLMKAVKLAAAIGVEHVITAEGEPHTSFGKGLTHSEAIFSVVEKLYEPLRLAEDLGVKILLEPHGHLTDSIDSTNEILERCHSNALGVNLDTGNLWLGGGDSLAYIKQFGHLIGHVHWKDLSADMIPQRGKIFGCGMSITPLGKGVCNIKAVYEALQGIGYNGYTTLEIAGEEAVLESYRFLKELGAE